MLMVGKPETGGLPTKCLGTFKGIFKGTQGQLVDKHIPLLSRSDKKFRGLPRRWLTPAPRGDRKKCHCDPASFRGWGSNPINNSTAHGIATAFAYANASQ